MLTSIAVITVESTGKAYLVAIHDVLSLLLFTAASRRDCWVNRMENGPAFLVFVFKQMITIVTSIAPSLFVDFVFPIQIT